MKTLLFLVTGFPPDVSGVSLFNWERAVGLAQHYRVVVVAPDWQSETPGHPPIPTDRLIVETYPSQPWLPYKLTHVPSWRSVPIIEAHITRHQPDIIVVTDAERLFLLAAWQLPGRAYARRQGIPYIAEYHTDLYNFSATYPGWQWLRWLVRQTKLTSYLYRQFDLTLCTSQAAQASCLEMGIANTHYLPFLGVDIADYHPDLADRSVLSPWLSETERQDRILLFVGRLGYEKRVDLLIEAFRQVDDPHTVLLLVGDGPLEVVQKLQRQAAAQPRIHFTGFLLGQQKAQVMAACDIFCSPSPYETFGRTIVEAMASGLPVISVASGAVAEYIRPGVNGYLVPPDDAPALAHAIRQVLDHPPAQQLASEDAQQFSIEHSCQQLDNFYRQYLFANSPLRIHGQLTPSPQ
jgi:phosphatidylinositol alpha 1,6-mannosyltransferase